MKFYDRESEMIVYIGSLSKKTLNPTLTDYDNATYYNDAVIHMIMQIFREKQTVLIYLSDHGEEVYDYRPRSGRDDFQLGADIRQSLRYQYSIPMSSTYR